ncbi:MAG TPA: hypothetical protein VIY29_16110, partial [Ktedonobacteraceae bacterium]
TELMDGGDVEGAIEDAAEHKLPLPQALAIAGQVCAGLEFAHSKRKGPPFRTLPPSPIQQLMSFSWVDTYWGRLRYASCQLAQLYEMIPPFT